MEACQIVQALTINAQILWSGVCWSKVSSIASGLTTRSISKDGKPLPVALVHCGHESQWIHRQVDTAQKFPPISPAASVGMDLNSRGRRPRCAKGAEATSGFDPPLQVHPVRVWLGQSGETRRRMACSSDVGTERVRFRGVGLYREKAARDQFHLYTGKIGHSKGLKQDTLVLFWPGFWPQTWVQLG